MKFCNNLLFCNFQFASRCSLCQKTKESVNHLLIHCLGPVDGPHLLHRSGLSLSVSSKRLNDELDNLSYQKDSKKTVEGGSL